MNKIVLSMISIVGLVLLAILADYFAFLGTKTRVEMDYAEITVEARNEETGAPIYDIHVRCWKKGSDNICTERKADRRDRVSVFIPIYREIEESWLFMQSEKPSFPEDTKFHFMLIHHDYENPIETLDMKEIYANRGQLLKVMMKPRLWLNKEVMEDS